MGRKPRGLIAVDAFDRIGFIVEENKQIVDARRLQPPPGGVVTVTGSEVSGVSGRVSA
jgi:hypothetical protein